MPTALLIAACVAVFLLGLISGIVLERLRTPEALAPPVAPLAVPRAPDRDRKIRLDEGRRVLALLTRMNGLTTERTFTKELPTTYRIFHGKGASETFRAELPPDGSVPDVVTFKQVFS